MSTPPDHTTSPTVVAALEKSGFTILRALGRGGMGVVYRANDAPRLPAQPHNMERNKPSEVNTGQEPFTLTSTGTRSNTQ